MSKDLYEAIDQMHWQPETEWFDTRIHTDRLMFCNEAGQDISVLGKATWSVEDYLAHVRDVGMSEAAGISGYEAMQLMNDYTRAAIVAQECASSIGTLATRSSGDLDFVEVSKWELKAMLEAAYTRGLEDGKGVSSE